MALDPRILLQPTTPDLLSSVRAGLGLASDIRGMPLREEILRQQAQGQAIPQAPAELQTFNELVALTNHPDPNVANAAKIRLRLMPGAGTVTGQERIAVDPTLSGQVATSQAGITGAQEQAKLEEQRRIRPEIERGVGLAKDAANLSAEIFERIGGIEQNIENMREGIRLVDAGAATGPVNKFLPSFRESSIKLDNLKNRLGLDVIGQVTFGALSKQELETAFDTAVPSNLRGDALKSWFQERIDTQTKLLGSLEDAGIFLSEEGATIPKLMARRRQQRKQTEPRREARRLIYNPQTGRLE